jgi:hypothetical protein
MEQKFHNVSVGHQSHTFHGTWGYVHVPEHNLVATLKRPNLTLEIYHSAIERVKSMTINPCMFLPTAAELDKEEAVWKSQIASVLHQYLALPKNPSTAIPRDPPAVEQIAAKKPLIHMLKLMDSSDNSAEGVVQVFELLIGQSSLSVEEFFSCIQPMNGDLGTVQNFNCLRSQRSPSAYPQDKLNNIRGITHPVKYCLGNIHPSLWEYWRFKGLWCLAISAGSWISG